MYVRIQEDSAIILQPFYHTNIKNKIKYILEKFLYLKSLKLLVLLNF